MLNTYVYENSKRILRAIHHNGKESVWFMLPVDPGAIFSNINLAIIYRQNPSSFVYSMNKNSPSFFETADSSEWSVLNTSLFTKQNN